MRIAFLCAPDLMPDAAPRHTIAHLFDAQREAISKSCAELGIEIIPTNWHTIDLSKYNAALALGLWDYQERPDQLLSLITDREGRGTPIFNSAQTIRWNIQKTYLRDLEAKGANIIPTLWPQTPTAADIKQAFEQFDTDTVILKRQIGAGAQDQKKFRKTDSLPDGPLLDRPGMIQPFMPAIQTEGEFSFIVIDGQLSHVICKRAASGDYRIQPSYGGTSSAITPSPTDLTTAMSVLDATDETPLYARIDMVRGQSGNLHLMELELIEPFLFPTEGPDLGPRLATALKKRLS